MEVVGSGGEEVVHAQGMRVGVLYLLPCRVAGVCRGVHVGQLQWVA